MPNISYSSISYFPAYCWKKRFHARQRKLGDGYSLCPSAAFNGEPKAQPTAAKQCANFLSLKSPKVP